MFHVFFLNVAFVDVKITNSPEKYSHRRKKYADFSLQVKSDLSTRIQLTAISDPTRSEQSVYTAV